MMELFAKRVSSLSMKSLRVLMMVGTLMVVAAGCVSLGKEFSASSVYTIDIGKTNKDDIIATFGEPYQKGMEDGDETWTYFRATYKLGRESFAKELYIRFNKDGTVKSFSYNNNFPGQ